MILVRERCAAPPRLWENGDIHNNEQVALNYQYGLSLTRQIIAA